MSGVSASSSDASRSVSFCGSVSGSARAGTEATDLLVVLAPAAAGLDEHKTRSALDIVIAQGATLPVLDGEVVRVAVDKLERGEDLGELALDGTVQRLDVVKVR
jgi:hypothetical protein